jgi:hypothetical protein
MSKSIHLATLDAVPILIQSSLQMHQKARTPPLLQRQLASESTQERKLEYKYIKQNIVLSTYQDTPERNSWSAHRKQETRILDPTSSL